MRRVKVDFESSQAKVERPLSKVADRELYGQDECHWADDWGRHDNVKNPIVSVILCKLEANCQRCV